MDKLVLRTSFPVDENETMTTRNSMCSLDFAVNGNENDDDDRHDVCSATLPTQGCSLTMLCHLAPSEGARSKVPLSFKSPQRLTQLSQRHPGHPSFFFAAAA